MSSFCVLIMTGPWVGLFNMKSAIIPFVLATFIVRFLRVPEFTRLPGHLHI